MTVHICADTRSLSAEAARRVWWELAIGTSPTTAHARRMGWGDIAHVVSGMCFGDADKLPGVMDAVHQASCGAGRTCQSRRVALIRLAELLAHIPSDVRYISGPAAQAERTRVWRV